MKTSHFAVIVVALVLVAALYLSSPRQVQTATPANASNGQFFSFLGGAIAGIANKVSAPSPSYSPPPVYVNGVGYVSGGANAPIDPSTGGVYLAPGDTYGPPAPT